MTSISQPQLTFNFEPSLPEQFRSLREYIAFRVKEQRLNAIKLAGQMDLSPSVLSRKLNQPSDDKQRLNVDDMEGYIAATGDVASVIEYLAAKYMDNDQARKARVIARVEHMLPDLLAAIESLKAAP